MKGGRRGLKNAEILLAESCCKRVSFESGFKQRKGRRISSCQISFRSSICEMEVSALETIDRN